MQISGKKCFPFSNFLFFKFFEKRKSLVQILKSIKIDKSEGTATVSDQWSETFCYNVGNFPLIGWKPSDGPLRLKQKKC